MNDKYGMPAGLARGSRETVLGSCPIHRILTPGMVRRDRARVGDIQGCPVNPRGLTEVISLDANIVCAWLQVALTCLHIVITILMRG